MIDRKKHQELRIQFNPDGSKLRTHQLELMDLLIYFDNICKQNNIRYWLSSGTLLGAIRHEGFIPWDDDVDVEMLREDYLKFLEVFVSNDVCELQTYDNDLFYTEPFPKLRLKNSIVSEGDFDKYYKYHGAFMDIFIMEESPYLMARFCHLLMGGTRRLMFLLLPKTFLCKIILRVCKPINMFIANVCRFLCSPFVKKGVLRHTYGTGLVKNIRIASDIFPLKSIEFENHYFFVPNNSINYLKRMFGNYMELPKHIHTHHIIKD